MSKVLSKTVRGVRKRIKKVGFLLQSQGKKVRRGQKIKRMTHLLSRLRQRVLASVRRYRKRYPKVKDVDSKIALGVLLRAVGAIAMADERVIPAEERKIKDVLVSYAKVSDEDFPIVLAAIRQAAIGKVDPYQFAYEMREDLSDDAKASILKDLFRVAYAEKELDRDERDIIEKISRIFLIPEKDFRKIDACVRKELGIA